MTRGVGQCAYPVDGESWGVRSCCNPCPGATYCAAHLRILRGPPAPSVEVIEAQLRALGLCD
ncbi:MAG TPA: hypothetical protein VGI30_01025 [Caulobacteraceae bacterium]